MPAIRADLAPVGILPSHEGRSPSSTQEQLSFRVSDASFFPSDSAETPTGSTIFGGQEARDDGGESWSTGSNGSQAIGINEIPEPTVVILSGLGLAAVLIFRRRFGRVG